MTDPDDAYLHAAELIVGADTLVIAAGQEWVLTLGCQTFGAMRGFGKPTPRLRRPSSISPKWPALAPSTKTRNWRGASTVDGCGGFVARQGGPAINIFQAAMSPAFLSRGIKGNTGEQIGERNHFYKYET